jgi:hypothetical protein
VISVAELRPASLDEIPTLLDRIDPDATREQLIGLVSELCTHFHILASASLFVDAKPQKFFLNLCRAGENWRRLLAHLRRRNEAPPPARMNLPFLGVVAAGHDTLSAAIATRSAEDWQPDEGEYEDEFLYATALYLLARNGESKRALEEKIERLEAQDGDLSETRAPVLRSLAGSDPQLFADAFEGAHGLHEEVTDSRAESFTTPVTTFVPYRGVWYEGLALLRFAEARGLGTSKVYRFCPTLARVPMTDRYDQDWVSELGAD